MQSRRPVGREVRPDAKPKAHPNPPRTPDRTRPCLICRHPVPRDAPDRVDIWEGGRIVEAMHAGCW
jgi:hypothetical protein